MSCHRLLLLTIFCMSTIKWIDSQKYCPQGWTEIESYQTCIKATNFTGHWSQVRKACDEESSDLLVIQNDDMHDAIESTLDTSMRDYWIGLHDQRNTRAYVWLDETKKTNDYTRWQGNDPNSYGKCVRLLYGYSRKFHKNTYVWDAVHCTYYRNGLCQQSFNASYTQCKDDHSLCPFWSSIGECDKNPSYMLGSCQKSCNTCQEPKKELPDCPEGWKYMEASGTCIKLFNQRKPVSEARLSCKASGGDLVTILTPEANMFLAGRVAMSRGYYWIGLNDLDNDGYYRWNDNGTEVTYTEWEGRVRDGYCAVLGKSDDYGKWADNMCRDKINFICEIPYTMSSVCTNGWIDSLLTGTCLKIYDEEKDWFEARSICQDQGGDLVRILDSGMNLFLTDELDDKGSGSYWIGLHDSKEQTKFEWVDGTPLIGSNWFPKQPNNLNSSSESQDCVQINSIMDYEWNDEYCSATSKFICQNGDYKPVTSWPWTTRTPTTTMTTTLAPSAAYIEVPFACPKSWIENTYSGSCIKFFTYKNGWWTARVNCQKEGADLVKITSIRLNDFIAEEARKIASGVYWIGLSDRVEEGSMRWLDDTEETTSTNLTTVRYSSSDGDDCVELYVTSTSQDWRVDSCFEKNPYVCEMSSKEVLDMKCPFGWTKCLASGTCIWASSRETTWPKARGVCQTLGGDLARIMDENSNKFISGYANDHYKGDFWIGLNDLDNDGEYKWSDDNSQYTFTAWRNGHGDVGACAVTGKLDYLWDASNCRGTENYLCEVQQSKSICRQGWTEIKSTGSCVKVFTDSPKTWRNSRLACLAEDADLLKIPDEFFNEFIAEMITSFGTRFKYWIGLKTDSQDDKFHWLDERDKATYFNWYGKTPSSSDGTCIIFSDSHKDKWEAKDCAYSNYRICEYYTVSKSPCGIGWLNIPETDKCIQLSKLVKDWENSRKSCKGKGGDLVTVISEDQNSFIADRIDLARGTYWLGLHDPNGDEEFSWLDHTAVASYMPWSSDSSYDKGTCVVIGKNQSAYGTWDKINCTKKTEYICEVASKDMVNCPFGWKSHIPSGTCIKVFEDKVNWGKARRICQKEGADLVKVWDPLMSTFITDEVNASTEDEFWIGLHDSNREGNFEWVDGSTIYYKNWYRHQPNNLETYGSNTSQDCVMLERSLDFEWNDVDCIDRTASFICQSGKYKFEMSTTTDLSTSSTTETTTTQSTQKSTTSTTQSTTSTTKTTTTKATSEPAATSSTLKSTVVNKEQTGPQSSGDGGSTKMSTTTDLPISSTTETTTTQSTEKSTTSTTQSTTLTTKTTTTQATSEPAATSSILKSTVVNEEQTGPHSGESGGLGGEAVAGIVISVLVVCAVLAGVWWRYIRRKSIIISNSTSPDSVTFSNNAYSDS